MSDHRSIEKLAANHDIAAFTSGEAALDQFLHRHALGNQSAGSAQTYVATENGRVIGYYTLSVGQVAHENAAVRIARGMPRYPIPVMLLARLAIATDRQGIGLGPGLLKDALLRTVSAAEIAGIRAMLVHAKNERAKGFYEHFGFTASPTDPLHLYLLLKDAKKMLDL